MDIIAKLAAEFHIRTAQVEQTVALIDEGNTIPFIARYRKEVTGGLSDVVLRDLDERLKYLRNLEERKEEVLRLIEEQGKLTEELSAAIDAARTLAEEGVSVRVVDMHTIKPLDKDLLLQAAKENLVAALPQRPDLLPVIDRLAPISAACEFNISAGHLSGWIAAVLS